jgi:peroxiredoxin
MKRQLSIKIIASTSMALLFLFMGCQNDVDAWPTAPHFRLQDLSGNRVTLEQFKGKVVLLDFWATWCPPCRKSIPELVELHRKYNTKGVVILGVSMDDPLQVNDQYLKKFIKKHKINYMIMRANQQITLDYFSGGQIGIPTMFVIDQKGKVRDKMVGFSPGKLERTIRALL